MKKLFFLGLAIASLVGFSKTNNVEVANASVDNGETLRVMANDWNCYPNPWDCAPTVIIVAKSKY